MTEEIKNQELGIEDVETVLGRGVGERITLRKYCMSQMIPTNLNGYTMVSILTGCIIAWFGNCTAQDQKKSQLWMQPCPSCKPVSLTLTLSSLFVASGKQLTLSKATHSMVIPSSHLSQAEHLIALKYIET